MEKKPIYEKLLAAQKKIGAIAKDSTNPFYNSKYFDINALLDVVKPILNDNGLILLQPLEADKLKTIIIDVESGEQIESVVNLPTNPDPQKMGSIITYFRRYSLQSFLGLQAEDDDAELAANRETRMPPKPPITGKTISEGLQNVTAPKINKKQIEILKGLYEQGGITLNKGRPMLTGLFLKEKTGDLTGAEATQLINWLKDAHEGKCNIKKNDAGVILRFEYCPEEGK